MINNLYYPKINKKDINFVYEFEIQLINFIANGELKKAIDLYAKFFNNYKVEEKLLNKNLENLKLYLNSLSFLISHNIIQKGISPYISKTTYEEFSLIINTSKNISSTIKIGEQFIKCYTRKIIKNIDNVDNLLIRNAIDYIDENLDKDLTLDSVSKNIGLSKCYFCTEFKKSTNMSFTQFINYRRIEKSKYLLRNTNMPLIDIAIYIGYNSQNYFSTLFKKQTNYTPKEYRDISTNDIFKKELI